MLVLQICIASYANLFKKSLWNLTFNDVVVL